MKISDIVSYFRSFYETRRAAGLKVEKANSVFAREDYTYKQAEHIVLIYPFKRFETMNMMRHTKTLGIIEVDGTIWKKLSGEEKKRIEEICDEKLEAYYNR